MKITGSRWELQIEDDNGNVAGFSGEACPGEFLADAASLTMLDEIERMVRLLTDLVMLLAAMPFLFLMLRVVRLHVAARGAVMTVRPTIGRTYSFPVSEITKVIRKVRPDPVEAPITRASIKKLTICTKARRVVLCESITGIEAIDAYLARHVDPEHIVTRA